MTEQVGEATRLALLERLLELATREPPPDEILREAAAALADAVGDVIVTYVELDEDGTLRPRATTNPEGLPPALPVFPEVIDALAEGPVVVPTCSRSRGSPRSGRCSRSGACAQPSTSPCTAMGA